MFGLGKRKAKKIQKARIGQEVRRERFNKKIRGDVTILPQRTVKSEVKKRLKNGG